MEDAQSAQKRAKERQEHVEALHSQHAEDKAHLEREKAEVLAARYAASLQNEALAAQLQTVSAQLVMPVLFGLPLDRQNFFFFFPTERSKACCYYKLIPGVQTVFEVSPCLLVVAPLPERAETAQLHRHVHIL